MSRIIHELHALDEALVEKRDGGPVAHVRVDGRSYDVALRDLELDPAASDAAVRQALVRYLEVPESALRYHVIDRHATGNLTVRPEAVFG